MSDHTPGPWFVVPLPWDDSGCLVTSSTEDPHTGEIIVQTDSGQWNDHTDEDIVRWQSNARLIAKAWLISDALKMFEHCVKMLQIWQAYLNDQELSRMINTTIKQVEILMAKLEDE